MQIDIVRFKLVLEIWMLSFVFDEAFGKQAECLRHTCKFHIQRKILHLSRIMFQVSADVNLIYVLPLSMMAEVSQNNAPTVDAYSHPCS